MPEPQRLALSWRKKLLFSLIPVLLLLVIAETVSWFYLTRISRSGPYRNHVVFMPYHPLLGWVNQPDTLQPTGKSFSEEAYAMRVDDEGCCVTPLQWDHADLTIVVTGGSTMFGVGSSGNLTTVPSQIETILHERTGRKIEVVNLAVRGYNSMQEMLSVYEYLTRHRADMVLAISGRNLPARHLPAGDPWANAVPLVRETEAGNRFFAAPLLTLKRYSYAVDLLDRVLGLSTLHTPSRAPALPPLNDEEYQAFVAKATQLNYDCLNAICRNHGARFRMFLQPMLVTKPAMSAEERNRMKRYWGNDIAGSFARERQARNLIYERIRSIPKTFSFNDLSNVFQDPDATLYVDYCHYNDEAAQGLAEAVVELILPEIEEMLADRTP